MSGKDTLIGQIGAQLTGVINWTRNHGNTADFIHLRRLAPYTSRKSFLTTENVGGIPVRCSEQLLPPGSVRRIKQYLRGSCDSSADHREAKDSSTHFKK